MPYTALHSDSGDIHFTGQANPRDKYLCVECESVVEYVRSYLREKKNGEKTRWNSHFRYKKCPHGTVDEVSDGTGVGGGSGGGGGESRIHERRKKDALAEALNRFPASDWGDEVPVGNKRADALLVFEEPHSEYGKGLVIEYQHKNEGKDIDATERHFARNGYTTVWLWEEQYSYQSSIPDIDLFGGRVYTPWPDAVPKMERWTGPGLNDEKREKWSRAYDEGLTNSVVEATIVKDWVLPTPREHWRKNGWTAAFRDENTRSTRDYRLQVAIGIHPSSIKVPATIPSRWVTKNHWKETDWNDRFRRENTAGVDNYRLQAAISKVPETINSRVTFPKPVGDTLTYRQSEWDNLFSCSGLTNGAPTPDSVELEIDFAPIFDRGFWLDHFAVGAQKRKDKRDERQSIDPPNTRFDDVQCHYCKHYQYAPNADTDCPNCGMEYDWGWNLETERISGDSVPDSIDV